MIFANGTVIVGDRTYRKGEAVEGLSRADVERMERDGFIKVNAAKKESAKPDGKKKKENE